ncbi:pyocin activator PrtN family protein [Pleomorphomonas sp. PLEO]
MNTLFLLMAQYNAAVIIPLDKVRADFFPHLGSGLIDLSRR